MRHRTVFGRGEKETSNDQPIVRPTRKGDYLGLIRGWLLGQTSSQLPVGQGNLLCDGSVHTDGTAAGVGIAPHT